jgi:anaerobic selenocysteine-containing dehydrogenase
MKQHLRSVCALDCPDTCSLKITVDQGKVVDLQGDPEHPMTRGFACVKTARYPERQEHPDRLLVPMRRAGRKGEGRFVPATWEEALDAIADRTRQILDCHGGQSILPYHYAGTMGLLEGSYPLALFRGIGALELDQTICASTGGAAWEANYGPAKVGPPPEDLVEARCIILWGIHLLRSNSHLAPILKEARRRGAQILHIDPYRNETSRFADEHWSVRVGTDAALALGWANALIEQGLVDHTYIDRFAEGWEEYREACRAWPLERTARYCNVPIDSLQRWIELYGKSTCSFIKVGYGMTRNEGGGNALRAITLLPAITGAWKKRGGGAVLSTSGAFALDRHQATGLHLRRPQVRHVNMNCLASELLADPVTIRGLFIFNSNPAAVAPDSSRVRQGLSREDLFTVVLEHFQTDSADYADWLLPATTFLEHPDLYTSYGHYYLQWADPVVPARGQARPNSWFFQQLAQRLGLTDPVFSWTPRQIAESFLTSDHPFLQGITLERLEREGSVRLNLPDPYLPYADGSHHPNRKIRFAPPPKQLDFEVQPDATYPLRLISPPGDFLVNTTMGNVESILRMAGGQPRVLLHPDDARPLGVEHLQMVEIRSPHGTILRQALVQPEGQPGTLIALGQWWPKLAPDRKSLNDLTSERLTDLGGGSTFGNPVVSVRPATDAMMKRLQMAAGSPTVAQQSQDSGD